MYYVCVAAKLCEQGIIVHMEPFTHLGYEMHKKRKQGVQWSTHIISPELRVTIECKGVHVQASGSRSLEKVPFHFYSS
jgi:hypothetical protein